MVSSIYGANHLYETGKSGGASLASTTVSHSAHSKMPVGQKAGAGQKTPAGQNVSAGQKAAESAVKITEHRKLDMGSSLIPTMKDGYGAVIGNAELSDKAKDYYQKLRSKFHNMDFILVSRDMKGRVAANAAAYGNANKPVVLIDEEKLERMATDESFRKKYEGIIEMSQEKLLNLKNSLASSGAAIRNFGMSVDENGKTSFFATLTKATDEQNRIRDKHRKAKKAERQKEHKISEKKENAERIRKLREKNRLNAEAEGKTTGKATNEATGKATNEATGKVTDELTSEGRGYIDLWAETAEDLSRAVSVYAYTSREEESLQEDAQKVGTHIDFRG